MRISDVDLRGRSVIGADGRAIGEILGVTIDSDGWRVDSLRVKLRREVRESLGVSRRLFGSSTTDIPIRAVQSVSDAVILSVSVDNLRELTSSTDVGAEQPHAVH